MRSGQCETAALPAEIDFANATTLGEALVSASTDHATVIVDMSANVLCDSSGLAELIKALKRAQAAGGELRLVMVSSHVRNVFKATGLDRLVKTFGTLSAAVAPPPAESHDVAGVSA
jgi:anti-sigma B factor antagonist